MPTLKEMIGELPIKKQLVYQDKLLDHLNDRKWCEEKGLHYNSLPREEVEIAEKITYEEIMQS
ncbi:MAG: hypothetical protein AABW50_03710 [Nanoarchaeota archaeon]